MKKPEVIATSSKVIPLHQNSRTPFLKLGDEIENEANVETLRLVIQTMRQRMQDAETQFSTELEQQLAAQKALLFDQFDEIFDWVLRRNFSGILPFIGPRLLEDCREALNRIARGESLEPEEGSRDKAGTKLPFVVDPVAHTLSRHGKMVGLGPGEWKRFYRLVMERESVTLAWDNTLHSFASLSRVMDMLKKKLNRIYPGFGRCVVCNKECGYYYDPTKLP